MEIYQCGGRLHAIDAAELIDVYQSDVQLWRFDLKGFNTGPPSASTEFRQPDLPSVVPPLRNDYVMIPQCSTLWPIEDVGANGYCYGWVLNSRLVCVAGVFQVGSLR